MVDQIVKVHFCRDITVMFALAGLVTITFAGQFFQEGIINPVIDADFDTFVL